MKKTLLLITLALLAGCNESKLAADNSTPPAGDDDDDGGTGGVIPVAVVLAGGGGGAGTLFDGASSYDPDDASADAIATFTWALEASPAGSNAVLSPAGNAALLDGDVVGAYTISLMVVDRDGLPSDKVEYTLQWLDVDIDGDCLTASCPAEAPYPVGCNIDMDGGDERGCVASSPMDSVVYFQEGDACGAGHVAGTLLCSATPGLPLTEANCPMNKSQKFYPAASNDCPDTN